MALNDEDLLCVYSDLHRCFPEDVHIARPLIQLLQARGNTEHARDLAMTMARRMLAAGRAEYATGFLELCRSLNHPQKEEIRSLSTLAAITTTGPVGMEPGEAKVFMLIDQLSDQEAHDFFWLGRLTHVAEGDNIVCQGEVGNSFYLILEGEMRVHVATEQRERIHLGNLKPGQFFGEFACIYHLPRSATVTAACPSLLLEFSDLAITQLMQRSPLAGERMMRTIQTRVVEAMAHSHPALEGIPEADRRWLAEESSVLEFKKGDLIGRQEEMGEACYVIVHGEAKASVERHGDMLNARMKAGDMFGDISAYLQLPTHTEITATSHCLVFQMPKSIFHSFMNVYGGFERWVKDHALNRTQQWRHAVRKKGRQTTG